MSNGDTNQLFSFTETGNGTKSIEAASVEKPHCIRDDRNEQTPPRRTTTHADDEIKEVTFNEAISASDIGPKKPEAIGVVCA